MKKILAFFVLIFLFNSAFSQGPSMAKGKVVVYLGVGAGSGNFGNGKFKGVGYSYRNSPVINAGFEYGFYDKVPKSIIGLGANIAVSFGGASYRDSKNHGYDLSWSDFTILAKGYYHHTFLVGEKWDVYGSPLVGLKFHTYSYTYNDPDYSNYKEAEASVSPAVGLAVGGRFYVSKNFGFYAEVSHGYNVDYLKLGLAFKF